MIQKCLPSILDESRDGHGSNSTGNWTDSGYILLEICIICISTSDSINKGTTYIDYDRFLSYHISREESWLPSCYDDDIRFSGYISQILSITIAARHSSSSIHEHESHRFSDNIGSSDYCYIFSSYIDLIVLENCHDSFWSTAPESVMSEEHITDLSTSETVDIFLRVDTIDHSIRINMRGKWRLDDDPMYFIIFREISYYIFELILSDGGIVLIESKSHSDFSGSFFLHTDIGHTRRILSYEHHSEHRLII